MGMLPDPMARAAPACYPTCLDGAGMLRTLVRR